jgi:hypothetical protein
MKACQANAECGALYSCFQGCGNTDRACQTQCVKDHPKGYGNVDEIQLCTYKNCKTNCGIPSNACYDCLVANCYNEAAACDQSQDCVDFEICAMGCNNDRTCVNNCATQHQQGAQIYMTLGKCLQNNQCSACFGS